MWAKVDDEDYERLRRFSWHIRKQRGGIIYARRVTSDNRNIALHREILNATKDMMVDYINHDGLDNRKCNLRVCSNTQNIRNSRIRKNNKSGFKGVHASPTEGKWIATIKGAGQARYLGTFDRKRDAARAYDLAAVEHYGEFACTNFKKYSPVKIR